MSAVMLIAGYCSDSFGRYRQSAELGEDRSGGGGPAEGPRFCVALIEVLVDRGLQAADPVEAAAPYPLAGERREERLDGIQP